VIVFNIALPQTRFETIRILNLHPQSTDNQKTISRKDSIVDQLATQGKGLTGMVFIFAMTWGFAYPAFIR